MPARSAKISSDDMAGMAILANDTLLPVINRLVDASLFAGHAYSRFTAPLTFENPQPAYSFDPDGANWLKEINRIRADYWSLVFQSDNGTGLLNNPAAINSGPWVVSVNDPQTFHFYPNPPPYQSFLSGIDAWQGVLPGSRQADTSQLTLFTNVQFGCNTTDSSNMAVDAGRRADFTGTNSPMTVAYSAGTAGDWTMEIVWQIAGPSASLPPDPSVFSPASVSGVTWTTAFNPNLGAAPSGHFWLIARLEKELSAGTGSVVFSFTLPGGYSYDGYDPGSGFVQYLVNAVSKLVIDTNSSRQPLQVVNPKSNALSFDGAELDADTDFYLTVNGGTDIYSRAVWEISNPQVKGIWTAKTFPTPALNVFLDSDLPPFVGLTLPGIESPYTSDVYGAVAVAQNLFSISGVASPFLASSAREQAPVKIGQTPIVVGGYTIGYDPIYSIVNQSTQPKATAWPCLKDTDFVPYDYGFNPNEQMFRYTGTANKSGALNYYVMDTYAGTTGVRGRAVQAGTTKIGWTSGALGYGTPIPTAVTFYVSVTGGYPTTSVYDYKFEATSFELTAAAVTLALAAGYVVIGFQNGNPAADLDYDWQSEILTGPVGRSFLPAPGTWECFSHGLHGSQPWFSTNYGAGDTVGSDVDATQFSKPIPQNGYCVFKLRATRLPVANDAGLTVTPASGADITITVGQNKLQWDGSLKFIPFFNEDNITPFTVTIRPDARDSGDVDVFWPVTEGTEIVFQCATPIIFEAWANWQPMFHFDYFAELADYVNLDHIGNSQIFASAVSPTAWQYCLSFTNNYVSSLSGYSPGTNCTHTQFPVSVEIYNDLVNSLQLLPAGGGGGDSGGGGDL